MIKSFIDKESEQFYIVGKSKKIPSTIHKVALRKLDYLNSATTINDLRIPPANCLEKLKGNLKGVIIAYEPVWAIGTGDFCKPEKAKQVLKFIKSKIKNKVLYGGSVNSKIAKDYTKVGFDGLLVGGASLDAKEFKKIIKNA